MKKFYEEYKDLSTLPPAVTILSWMHNRILLEKVEDDNIFFKIETCQSRYKILSLGKLYYTKK